MNKYIILRSPISSNKITSIITFSTPVCIQLQQDCRPTILRLLWFCTLNNFLSLGWELQKSSQLQTLVLVQAVAFRIFLLFFKGSSIFKPHFSPLPSTGNIYVYLQLKNMSVTKFWLPHWLISLEETSSAACQLFWCSCNFLAMVSPRFLLYVYSAPHFENHCTRQT